MCRIAIQVYDDNITQFVYVKMATLITIYYFDKTGFCKLMLHRQTMEEYCYASLTHIVGNTSGHKRLMSFSVIASVTLVVTSFV